MINLAITSTQSKAARAALGISQSKVAQATGINRSQLALFEVQKYLLPQARLKTLRAYYGGLGYEFDAPGKKAKRSEDDSREVAESAAQSDAKVIDRFLVPVGLADDTLESLIEEIDANDRRIDELAQQETEIDWVSWGPKPAGRDEILRLMARNYLRVRQLQYGEANQADAPGNEKPEKQTTGDLVAEAIGLPLMPLTGS